MGLIRWITQGFIDFFGITQPTPEEERRARYFITGLLLLIILGAAAIFTFVVITFSR